MTKEFLNAVEILERYLAAKEKQEPRLPSHSAREFLIIDDRQRVIRELSDN